MMGHAHQISSFENIISNINSSNTNLVLDFSSINFDDAKIITLANKLHNCNNLDDLELTFGSFSTSRNYIEHNHLCEILRNIKCKHLKLSICVGFFKDDFIKILQHIDIFPIDKVTLFINCSLTSEDLCECPCPPCNCTTEILQNLANSEKYNSIYYNDWQPGTPYTLYPSPI